ncbi:MAG: hypothetical protein HY465_01945 [Deltaproteobacteria bacterium]|nr:hypothetical protein [Deltaproteobacteria bacterium]
MGQKMTWEEIKNEFPDEWVALCNIQGDLSSPLGDISGEVVAHHHEETLFTTSLKKACAHGSSVDIRYTGELLPDNPVGPLLWRISAMNS